MIDDVARPTTSEPNESSPAKNEPVPPAIAAAPRAAEQVAVDLTTTRRLISRRRLGRLAFESTLIVFSVLLALVLNEVRTQFVAKSQHVEALHNIRAELAHNAEVIGTRHLPLHSAILARIKDITAHPEQIAALKRSGLDYTTLAPGESWVPSLLHDTAWEVANTSGTPLTYYERFALTRVYGAQRDGVQRTLNRLLDLLLSPDFSDPSRAESKLRQLQILLTELVSQEDFLLNHAYRNALADAKLWSSVGRPAELSQKNSRERRE